MAAGRAKTSTRRSSCATQRWSVAGSAAIFAILLLLMVDPRDAKAELGPCTTAAPTTPNVVVFVSDLGRSARWYSDKIGLLEETRSCAVERRFAHMIMMTRGRAGLTLASSGGSNLAYRDPQAICLVLDGSPAPSSGSPPVFLADPDGVSIELPAFSDTVR